MTRILPDTACGRLDRPAARLARMVLAAVAGLLAPAWGLAYGQVAPPAPPVADGKPEPVQFDRDIRPLLADRCFSCHGPDAASREADLRLDLRESVLGPREGQPLVVPGDPRRGELLRRVRHSDPDQRMPPADSQLSLTPAEIELLSRWVAEGAVWRSHWAYESLQPVAVPEAAEPAWCRNPIDRFVAARRQTRGLAAAAEADRATLIRRATFDLTGLPPTPEAVDRFLADPRPDAYERLVDRLLASPAYGEHMARHWLDAARYADTNGYQYDTERTQWPWRDWVIRAYNAGMPFDQFTREQLAGDLLPKPSLSQRIATGFQRNHGITIEGGVIDEEYRTEYVVDRLVTNATVWMGTTLICARCHDHKYDPISQREFYQLLAFFNQVPERGNSGFAPRVAVPSPDLPPVEAALAGVEAELARLEPQLAELQRTWEAQQRSREERPDWVLAAPTSVQASSGAPLEAQPDGSHLAGGDPPGQEIYEVILESRLPRIHAIRLEALTHPSLPHGGPGRAFNSNFVLSEVDLAVRPLGSDEPPKSVAWASAEADYSQQGYEIARAIDGQPGTGWAVDGPTRKEPRVALFRLREPVGFPEGAQLRLRLRHHFGTAHAIGRFRLSLSERAGAGLADSWERLLGVPLEQRTAEQREQLRRRFLETAAPAPIRSLHQRRDELARRRETLRKASVQTMVMEDMPQARATFVLDRGQYDQRRDEVQPATPAVFPPLAKPADGRPTRLEFANWLLSPQHPLTARVAVNRYWQQYFGVGLVKTQEDFGTQGERPSHPLLLDWLASRFLRDGWDVKALQRLIVTSATYRQSSLAPPAAIEADPDNRWLARGPRRRLTAEQIRDSALLASGLLVFKQGGPSVYPYHPAGLWLEVNNRPGYSRAYEQGQGEALYRRSLYTFWKRTVPPPTMQAFDAPEREFCVVSRSATNTPLQAFVLLHDPQFVEAARQLAERVLRSPLTGDDPRIRRAFRLVLAREPGADELRILGELLRDARQRFSVDLPAARQLLEVGESPSATGLPPDEQAAWTQLAQVLLNLHEAVTKP